MGAATIRIFLADGTPLGIRLIEKSNWTGRAIDFARPDWVRARSRDDFGKPGVYVLTGVTDDGLARAYIGEADVLVTRINQHFSGPGAKEFWTRAIAFTSKDENLNKAHVRYLESRLVAMAQAAKRAKIENSSAPAAPSLSESDRAEAEAFLEEMLLVYPLLGVDAFTPPPAKADDTRPLLYLKGRGITAQGRDTETGFVVYQGSKAAKMETGSLHQYIRTQRAALLASGVLVDATDTLALAQDYPFSSPSTAAAVMLGAAANGRTEWKDATGKTLKALQA
ncbi:MAG TPA: GIY-YIG nuclease family protein [Candidatus Limnocylindrales bacterium]